MYYKSFADDIQTEITLKEAVTKANAEAKKWNPLASLILITSADAFDPNIKGPTEGKQGKRRMWNLIFGVPGTDQSLLVKIEENKISNVKEIQELVRPGEVVPLDQIAVDSPFLVEQAIQEFGMKPGVHFARGYHFELFSDNHRLFFSVEGLNQRNKRIRVFFNPNNGRYLGMEVEK
ncbi:hypothetical protein ACFO25_15370 [Paenactinomyces guangxiensis]|uniref:Uncharacterized protein n=1 Tax=Paenactinomyces guangxiensis TaxID=1490290 RepID=A0A7W1WTJ8_9BACL|nr:hypothetical protein [Paenactinomyces guangxiensis]MBA4495581.1 hypothetical protein [Paenactinomyces guangxiensis]MBH8592839.1 hypothetical protein [Paenactinomyces guangxiensis]